MLLVPYIKENKAAVIAGLEKRNFADAAKTVEEVLAIDQQRRDTQGQHDQVLSESNALAKQIGGLMKEGKREEADQVKQKTAALKNQGKELGDSLHQFEESLKNILYTIPNIPNDNVPTGHTEDDNKVISEHGSVPNLYDGAVPHWDLIKQYDIVDFDLGNKVAGAGFPFYKGKGARLQRALVNFFLNEAQNIGCEEVQPPIMINEASGYGTGQLPDKEGQMYHVTEEDLYLIPTAEVPITNMYRDAIVETKDLPIKHVGFTPCFRREAGSWGAHVRGLNRLHQFDKVEVVQIQHPEKSYEALEELCKYVQGLLEKLGLQYRVLNLCAGDLGFTAAQTYDMEVYSAAQKQWLEVSSVSNFETYQANRLKLRYRGEDKKTHLLHTLNGSALALPRILAAILENNQTPEGIKIPEVLIPYCGFDMIN
jgi:seryl-tRNA synthetase